MLLLMNDDEHQAQLNSWLSDTYDVTTSTATALPDDEFDLYVIDSSRIASLYKILKSRQDAALPQILPALVISTPEDTDPDFSEDLRSIIHDILTLPMTKISLQKRISNTLRLREFSQENYQIQKQRERLRKAIASSDDAVVISDASGGIIYSNDAFFHLYTEFSGQVDAATVPDDFLVHLPLFSLVTQVANTKETVTEEIEFSTATNGNRVYLFRVDYIEAQRDQTEILIIATDITKRKQSEQQAHEQQIFAEALRDTATALTSTLNINEVLERILTNVVKVVPHDSANIMLIEDGLVRIMRSRGYDEYDEDTVRNFSFHLVDNPHFMAMIDNLYTIIVPDMTEYENRDIVWHGTHTTSYIGTPISVKDEILGFINLDSRKKDFFTDTHAELLEAFAEQVAIALYNARLYEQVQSVATLQERQRLARDLHDAVSQTLFSASVIAELLARNWAETEEDSQKLAVDLHQLIRGALAETRVLLLELRPEALENTELSELLRQLADAAHSRKELDIHLDLLAQPQLPRMVKIVFYRIAQEAMSNIVKHSRATQLQVQLMATEHGLTLKIEDDGDGFEVNEQAVASRMGLAIMQERAQSIGAQLKIESTAERGTQITLVWNVEG